MNQFQTNKMINDKIKKQKNKKEIGLGLSYIGKF